jgi:hypothetical protein
MAHFPHRTQPFASRSCAASKANAVSHLGHRVMSCIIFYKWELILIKSASKYRDSIHISIGCIKEWQTSANNKANANDQRNPQALC